ELGYVTQESGDSYPDSAGNVLDINATYTGMGLTVGVEYLKPDEAVDSAIGFTANYKISNMLNATVMYDVVKSADPDTDDKTSYALALGVDLDPSLSVAAEYYNFNDGKDDDPAVGLKFIASF
ncbi:MAG: porin, partial [Gammaproteobacteria bacterium]|nr:porin [Gammaproteobacteria bacterium]